MKNIVLIAVLLSIGSTFGQKIKFNIVGQKDTVIHLVKYTGNKLYYADTANIKGGIVEFDGKKQKPGLLAVLMPGQKYFEFVYNNEEVDIETFGPDYFTNMKVKKSAENQLFIDYMAYLTSKRKESTAISDEQKMITDVNSDKYKELTKKSQQISDEVLNYQKELIAKYPNSVVALIVSMSIDIKIPDAPKDQNGKITDSTFQYRYYRAHFFDNFNLKDDRITATPLYHNKLETFFGTTMMQQQPDTILKYAYELIDKLNPKSSVYELTVTSLMTSFEKNKIMGMDKVWIKLGEKYICSKASDGKNAAFWLKQDKIDDFCGKVNVQKNLVIGSKPANISLLDTTEKVWKDFYSLKSEYTVLYFWSPNCGHCKVTTPKLQKLYEQKLKARNVEVFAVTAAVGEDYPLWKKFIKDNHITFINVALTESIIRIAGKNANEIIPKYTSIESIKYDNYYDVVTTPRVFVLDKDKKIIAKQLSISQLEDFLDNIQKVKNPVKIIPEDPKEAEDAKH